MSGAPLRQSGFADRLQDVRVSPRRELEISRHLFGGDPCYVVRDPLTFASHKLSREDYQVFVALRADRPLRSICSELIREGTIGEHCQEDFYSFVVRLNQLGLLNLPLSDGRALYSRFARRKSAERKAKILSLLFLRVPLVNPDAMLGRTKVWVSPLLTRAALGLWMAGLLLSGLVIVFRWEEFCSPLGTMLAAQNLPLVWMLLIGLKVIHELGHAYACRQFGGHVTEMGAYFILFTPCAYVDASSAWGFPSRAHRVVVSLAGMYFESLAAMVALLVWCLTGPGLLRSAAQYVVVLSTLVTVGFNMNPLAKYDGYYLVSDLLGRPNLRAEAMSQVKGLLKRLLLGVREPEGAGSPNRHLGLVIYGIAAVGYRALVLLGIGIAVAVKVPVMGVGAAVLCVGAMLWRLIAKLLRYVLTSPEVVPVRRRAWAVLTVASAGILAASMLLPSPGRVQAVGTLAGENDRVVRAQAAGFLRPACITVGRPVEAETILAKLENMDVKCAANRQKAVIDLLRVQLHDQLARDQRAAAATQQNLLHALQTYKQFLRDEDNLNVRTPISGQLVEADGLRRPGRFVRKGEPLATVGSGRWVLKAMARAESLADHLPKVGEPVQIRPIGQGDRTLTGRVVRVAMAGSRRIEQPSLTQLGGGEIAVSANTMKAVEPFFEVVVAVGDEGEARLRRGMTAVVRFGGPRQPIGVCLYRRGLRLFHKLLLAG